MSVPEYTTRSPAPVAVVDAEPSGPTCSSTAVFPVVTTMVNASWPVSVEPRASTMFVVPTHLAARLGLSGSGEPPHAHDRIATAAARVTSRMGPFSGVVRFLLRDDALEPSSRSREPGEVPNSLLRDESPICPNSRFRAFRLRPDVHDARESPLCRGDAENGQPHVPPLHPEGLREHLDWRANHRCGLQRGTGWLGAEGFGWRPTNCRRLEPIS